MPWYYNDASGLVRDDPAGSLFSIPALDKVTGWHGPYPTQQAAIDFYNANKAAHPNWKAPTTDVPQGAANQAQSTANTVAGKLGLSNEAITSWMIRIGEILLGIVLVGVGIAKLTGTTNAVSNIVKARI